MNKEYAAIVDALLDQKPEEPDPRMRKPEDKAALRSDQMDAWTKRTVRTRAWNSANQKAWKELRKTVLTYPTCEDAPEGSMGKCVLLNYAEPPDPLDEYTYDEHGNYGRCLISFSEDRPLTKMVSQHDARLPELMSIPGVEELFKRNGWARTWQRGSMIMTPVLFNNIYKGALGESVGRFLLETRACVGLLDVDDPNLFELFDFRLSDANAFVDFKHWHEGFALDADEELEHINEKMCQAKSKMVAIVNVLGRSSSGYSSERYNFGEGRSVLTVPYLFDLDKGAFASDNLNAIRLWGAEARRQQEEL